MSDAVDDSVAAQAYAIARALAAAGQAAAATGPDAGAEVHAEHAVEHAAEHAAEHAVEHAHAHAPDPPEAAPAPPTVSTPSAAQTPESPRKSSALPSVTGARARSPDPVDAQDDANKRPRLDVEAEELVTVPPDPLAPPDASAEQLAPPAAGGPAPTSSAETAIASDAIAPSPLQTDVLDAHEQQSDARASAETPAPPPAVDPHLHAAYAAAVSAVPDSQQYQAAAGLAHYQLASQLPHSGQPPPKVRPTRSKRQQYARVSCEACRKKKSRCILPAGTHPTEEPLIGNDRCQRCVKLNLVCVLRTNARQRSSTGRKLDKPPTPLGQTFHPPGEANPTSSPERQNILPQWQYPAAAPTQTQDKPRSGSASGGRPEDNDLASEAASMRLLAMLAVSSQEGGATTGQQDDNSFAFDATMPQHMFDGSELLTGDPSSNGGLLNLSDPAFANDVNLSDMDQDLLKRSAATYGNPFSQLSLTCWKKPSFGLNLKTKPPPIPSLTAATELLQLIDVEMSNVLQENLRPFLLFYPHLMSIDQLRHSLTGDGSPATTLLLSTLYYIGLTNLVTAKNLLVTKAQGHPHYSRSKTGPSTFAPRMSHLQMQLKALIRTKAEEVLANPNLHQNDVAAQALELLYCYHPLALERIAPLPTPENGEHKALGLGQDLLSTSLWISAQLGYDRFSAPSCSSRYWSLATSDAALGAQVTSVDVQDFLHLDPLAIEQASEPYLVAHSIQLYVPEPEMTDAFRVEARLRQLGFRTLSFRLAVRGQLQKGEDDLRDIVAAEQATSPSEALTNAIWVKSEEYRQAIQDQYSQFIQHLGTFRDLLTYPSAPVRASVRTLAMVAELETQQAQERLMLSALLLASFIAADSTAGLTKRIDAKVAQGDATLRAFGAHVEVHRRAMLMRILTLVVAISEAGAIDIVPQLLLCSAALRAAVSFTEGIFARVESGNVLVATVEDGVPLLEQTANQLIGVGDFSGLGRKKMFSFGVAEGDVRALVSSVIGLLGEGLMRTHVPLLDYALIKAADALKKSDEDESAPVVQITDAATLALVRALGDGEGEWIPALDALA